MLLNNSIVKAYHGSDTNFTKFDYKYINTENGIDGGFGFYFTDDIEEASSYGKYCLECDLSLKGCIYNDELTLSKQTVSEILSRAENILHRSYFDIVWNGDEYAGMLYLMTQLFDVNIIRDIISGYSAGVEIKLVTKTILQILVDLGYNHTIDTFSPKDINTKHYIMFDNEAIKLIKTYG